MSSKTHRDAHAKLDRLYARLPSLQCKGLCSVACGPIPMTLIEADRLRRLTHREPRTVPVRCSLLTAGNRCSAYAARPLICRTWGTVKRMSCMHGCEPDRWLSDHEFLELAKAVERIGGRLVVTSPDGVIGLRDSFLTIDASQASPAEAEADAERTRTLRALLGGKVLAVTHRGPGGNFNLDDPADRERLQAWKRGEQ